MILQGSPSPAVSSENGQVIHCVTETLFGSCRTAVRDVADVVAVVLVDGDGNFVIVVVVVYIDIFGMVLGITTFVLPLLSLVLLLLTSTV